MTSIAKGAKIYLRSIIFGFEDSLVSTTGAIAGISTGVNNPKIVLLAGVVTVAVEALSMGAGQYLSEKSEHEAGVECKDNLYVGAGLMFGSYIIAGFVPLLPIIFLPFPLAIYVSVIFALIALYLLGFVKGKIVNVSPSRSGMEMLIIGGAATLIGVAVGAVLKI